MFLLLTFSVPVLRTCLTCAGANFLSRLSVWLHAKWYALSGCFLHSRLLTCSLLAVLDYSRTNDSREEPDLPGYQAR